MSVRDKIVELKLTYSTEDGHWLHFEDSNEKHVGINIENHFNEPDDIIGSCIRQWAKDQFENDCPICESPLEDNGACSDLGSNNCQYQK